MPAYKLYVLDAKGRLMRRQDIIAVDDEEARGQAPKPAAGTTVELWLGGSLVSRESDDGTPANG